MVHKIRLRTYRELYKSSFGISAYIRKKIHVSVKDLRVYANNPKFEDFIIPNHHYEFLRMYANIFTSLLRFGVSASAQNPTTMVCRILLRPRVGEEGGTLIFSSYVVPGPASTLRPQKISGISNTPKNI